LANRLQAAPTVHASGGPSRWSFRWLIPAGALGIAALVMTLVNPFSRSETEPPFALPEPPATTLPATTTTSTTVPDLRVIVVDVVDPSQDGERDAELPNLTDGDRATSWRTERYFAPITLIKPGVGVSFVLDRPPSTIELDGSGGTVFDIRWAPTQPASLDEWETVASGALPGDGTVTTTVDLPPRAGGFWLLWLTELSYQGQSDQDPPQDFYYSFIYEVRFSP